MSNKIYENGLYNEYQKQRYLITVSPKSLSYATRILNRANTIEQMYDIDLYNFSLHQIEHLLHYLNPTTWSASKNNFYAVRKYIRWGIEQNLRDNNLNPLETLGVTSYFKGFVDTNKKTLLTKQEIYQIIATCVNAQDSAPVLLIFEGLFGTSAYDELLNLSRSSIIENNFLRLQDQDEFRTVQVSDKCIQLMQRALDEKVYTKKNGMVSPNLKSSPEVRLGENDYVLRNVETRNVYTGKADKHLVLRRFTASREYTGLKVLHPKMVRNSGMLYMAKCILDRDGRFGDEQRTEIYIQFGIKETINNGYIYQNDYRFINDFLNAEAINRIYC